jgi:hypothetical protein
MSTKEGTEVVYLNSGDWVENLSALEYVNGAWSLYQFKERLFEGNEEDMNPVEIDLETVLESLES